MRSFFPEAEDYLPPPQARCIKPLHTGLGDATRQHLQKLALPGKVGMVLVLATLIVGFAVGGNALAAGHHAPLAVAAHPTATPTCAYVACNPWHYNFTTGRFITHPPAAFCHYFTCISNFSKGKGYIEECRDGMYSKSGGRSGSCADHRGNWRPLLGP